MIFNYAGVMTVPSWVNERRRGVSIHGTLWASTLITTLFMLLVGLLGALAYAVPADSDLLAVINASPESNIVTQVAVYAFPFAGITTSIPVFAIIIRYNLLESGLVGRWAALFWSVIFPWLIVIPFYTGDGLQEVINWSSLICSGITNFVLPFVLYIAARRYKASLPLARQHALDQRVRDDEAPEEPPSCLSRRLGLAACCPSSPPSHALHRPHFALPRAWDELTGTILAGTLALVMLILIVGVVVLDVLSLALPPAIFYGHPPVPATPLDPPQRKLYF